MSMKSSHLTSDDRIRIESLLREGFSIRYIADRLGKAPSTVSREIRKHSIIQKPRQCDCLYSPDCSLHHVCSSKSCKKKCKLCAKAKRYCGDYVMAQCDILCGSSTHLCNSCHKKNFCHFERRIYDAKKAEAQYRDKLVNSRNGFDLTAGQFEQINEIVSPLVKKGQSLYHIAHSNKASLPVSESTLRRLIAESELDIRNIDLPEAVKRKPRKKRKTHSAAPISKAGHLYADYLDYISSHDVNTVQMDCVEGKREDKGAILTLHFPLFHMQLFFILDEHISSCVVDMLDRIELSLGKELFASTIPLILTDNGHEFSDIQGIERSIYGGRRTHVFFCEPNRSDEKAECENNHKLLRRIVPKGTSLDHCMQQDITLMTNHINSYKRKSLFGNCPYDFAMSTMPEDFFTLLGLEKIPPDEVVLSPDLFKHS